MNVRFGEACREKYLELEGSEPLVLKHSVDDCRTPNELRQTCQQDIYIGVFFDGTNNNKYRDK